MFKKCNITGVILSNESNDNQLSIDIINSNGHYTVDNIQLITQKNNIIKSDINSDFLIEISNDILNYCTLKCK